MLPESHRLDDIYQDQAALEYWEMRIDPLRLMAWRRKILFKQWIWRGVFCSVRFFERALDLSISMIVLCLSMPFFAIVAIAIYLEDKGPIFFKQQRVGEQGRCFEILKFRSMQVHADHDKKILQHMNHHATGVTFKMKQDPRITRVGSFLRRTSIDELPQLINVIRGEMSLFGPRPAVPSEVAQYQAAQLRRLMVKPGITCLWQIGGRGDIDFEGQVRLDLQYIRSESIWEDIKILLRTIPAVIFGRGAY